MQHSKCFETFHPLRFKVENRIETTQEPRGSMANIMHNEKRSFIYLIFVDATPVVAEYSFDNVRTQTAIGPLKNKFEISRQKPKFTLLDLFSSF